VLGTRVGTRQDVVRAQPQRLDRLDATGGVMTIGLGATLSTTGRHA
jgi:hypothetical protein